MDAQELLEKIVTGYREIMGENLAGIYLHGSLAFGCFTWEKSDIDFIAVAHAPLSREEKRGILKFLLELTPVCPPKGLEMSVVLLKDCRDFHHPAPFELHFSGEWLPAVRSDMEGYLDSPHGGDPDLAAHFTVIRAVGKALWGLPMDQVFSPVPRADYIDSIRGDVEGAEADILENPVYIALNLCRVLAYLKEGRVLSKRQGGEWGLENLDAGYKNLLEQALSAYGGRGEPVWDPAALAAFAREMLMRIRCQTEDFVFQPMSQRNAERIAGDWHYPGEYAFYDVAADDEDYAELISPEARGTRYFEVLQGGELVGFVCLEENRGAVELGLGLRPDLTGKGMGQAFLAAIENFVRAHNPEAKAISLSVAAFNRRARRVYERAGFAGTGSFMQPTNGGMYEFIRMEKPLQGD